jgi:hypothetical protein
VAADDPRIQALIALPAAERRAQLKAMDAEQRRGVWFGLKKALAESRSGAAQRASSAYKGGGTPATARPAPSGQRAVGTIQYDSGIPSTSFGGGAIVGNRFNTHTGIPVFLSGSVNTVQAVVVPGSANTSSSAGFVLLGPQTGGGGALAIFSTFTAATGATDTLTFTGMAANYTGSSFYVLFGDFANSYIPVFGTGTTLAQGHHAVVGYTGGMGPNITGTFNLGGNLNSFVRAGGNIVPVELMTFSVE